MSAVGAHTFSIWVRGFALGVRVRGSWELSRQGSAPVAPPPAYHSGVRPDDRPRRRWSEARSSGRWPEVRVTPQRVRKPLHLWRKSRRVYVTRGLLSIILELHFEARVCTRAGRWVPLGQSVSNGCIISHRPQARSRQSTLSSPLIARPRSPQALRSSRGRHGTRSWRRRGVCRRPWWSAGPYRAQPDLALSLTRLWACL